ncbi:MAG: ATP-binding protein [Leptospiraceae bacterium]|nr:ATP-binding protein [Leptospiraceae bacterium]
MSNTRKFFLFKELRIRYQFFTYGALFGFCFPIFSTLFDIYIQGMNVSLHSAFLVQKNQPLHWVIDTAPFFLGLFAMLGGIAQEKVLLLNSQILQKERVTHDKFEILFNDAKFGILLFNWKTQKFDRINPTFLNMLGYTFEELAKIGNEVISDPEDLIEERKIFRKILTQKQSIQYNKKYISKDKRVIHTKVTQSFVRDETGKLSFILTLIDDITKEYLAEQELIKEKENALAASRAKSLFLANMSHEIRTPMNGILGMTHILSETNLNQEQKEITSTIESSANSLLIIINDILDFSKIESGKILLEKIEFPFKKLFKNVIDLFQPKIIEKNLKLEFNFSEEIPETLIGDPTRIRQILVNLIGNSIKFTEKGSIAISFVILNIDIEVLHLSIEVKDTGIGMDAETIKNLFRSFVQADSSTNRKYGGTGLGLAITKRLVELMDGSIQVKSEVGIGTTFSIQLKLGISHKNSELIKPSKEIKIDQRISFGDIKILLAEDNHINQIVAIRSFQKLGINVDIANNGKEAVESVQTKDYNFIFMDMQMPMMDGLEATRTIRRMKDIKQPKIIAMTANAMIGDREICFEAGLDEYISKPFKVQEIEEKLLKFQNSI